MEKTTTIGYLLKHEPESVEYIIASEIIIFADILGGTSNAMTVAKAVNIAKKFCELPELKHIRPEELAIFFREAFAFRYGKLYGAFGWGSLAEWWQLFWQERIDTAEDLSLAAHLSQAHQEKVGRDGSARIITPAHLVRAKEEGL